MSSHTVKSYFDILVDTLLGRWLPAYRRRPKRRVAAAPKFYLTTGVEVDFIVNDMKIAIEAKATAKVTDHHLKGLRELAKDHSGLRQRAVVCLEPRPHTLP